MRLRLELVGFGLTVCLCLFALASSASAEKRVALVVGNSAYENSAQLPNPVNDAQAVAGLLKAANFEVVNARTNLGNLEFKRALRDFSFAANNADIAVVFFAGHGIEVKGTNYLLPVDAKLAADYDAEDEAVSLNRVIEATENAKRLRLIILDACRDNPFIKTMKRSASARAVTNGLAKVEPASTDTIIAYAAKAGSTADDGAGANSPFTAALLKHLTVPGRDVRIAFGHVRDEVLANTGRKQEPFVYGSLGGTAVELVPAATPVVSAPVADQDATVRRDYEFAERIGTKEAWDSFLASYSTGLYARLAQAQRNKLIAEENRVAATEKAQAAEQARRAAEGAQAAERAKARAEAEAAERERKMAEAAKKAEEDKLAEIERAKPTVQASAVLETASADKPAADTPVTEKPIGPVAALNAATPADAEKPAGAQVPRLLLTELRRVGCHTASIDDNWNATARRALERYNKQSGRTLDTTVASLEALDAVKGEKGRVCPLQCGAREVERNGSCVAKTCGAGLVLDSDGDCVKPKGRTASAPPAQKPAAPEPKAAPRPPQEKSAGGSGHNACFASCTSQMLGVGWKMWEASQVCGRKC